MINDIGQESPNIYSSKHKLPEGEIRSDIPGESIDEKYLKDCYQKQSEKDVPMMKGDRGPRLKYTYMRWDQDLQMYDKREAGSLPLMRRDTKAKTLAKKYREFALLNVDVSLGTIRSIYGTIGISEIRRSIRKHGVPLEFRK